MLYLDLNFYQFYYNNHLKKVNILISFQNKKIEEFGVQCKRKVEKECTKGLVKNHSNSGLDPILLTLC